VFSLFVLSSYAQPIDKVGLLPGEARKLALAELTLHKRIGQISRLLSPLTPEDALRRHGIEDAKAAPALDQRDLPDVAAIQSRFEHVVPAPPGSAASTRDPEAYALALLYPDLQVGAAALYTETKGTRLGFFWRGMREDAEAAVEALRADPLRFDRLWREVTRFPKRG